MYVHVCIFLEKKDCVVSKFWENKCSWNKARFSNRDGDKEAKRADCSFKNILMSFLEFIHEMSSLLS